MNDKRKETERKRIAARKVYADPDNARLRSFGWRMAEIYHILYGIDSWWTCVAKGYWVE